MKFKTLLVAVGVIGVFGAFKARGATVLYSTDFNAPTYSDGAINTNTDTTTAGQAGWINTSGGGTNNISVANSTTNGTVSLTTAGQDIRHLFASTGAGSYYLKVDITVSTAQTAGDYFLSLGDGSTNIFNGRTYIKSSATGFVMALGTSTGTATYGTTVLAFGTTYTILVRYDLIAGAANDTGALFVNPSNDDGTGDSAYVAATNVGTDATAMAGVYLRQGAAASAAGLTLDNLSVSYIPEPSSVLLGALGLLPLLRRKR